MAYEQYNNKFYVNFDNSKYTCKLVDFTNVPTLLRVYGKHTVTA